VEIVNEVKGLIDSVSVEVGLSREWEMRYELLEKCSLIGSPIEQMLYCALKTIKELNYLEDLKVVPQYKIGQYRVDFLVAKKKVVIIECDSQQFHERTEPERRYEKARDRFLQVEGYKIFHYTGASIKNNSLDIAKEIIAYVLDCDERCLCKSADGIN